MRVNPTFDISAPSNEPRLQAVAKRTEGEIVMLRVHMVLVSLLFIALSVCARAEDGAPLTIAGARQYDIVSRINGQIYRLMVGSPEKTDPAVTYPVFYVLDGNENFGTAVAMARRLHGCCEVPPAIVVGIGYRIS